MYMNIIPTEQVLTFMLGGKAQFVLWNQESGNRFEYVIKRSSKVETVWNVYYDHTYIGSIYTWYEHLQFKIGKGIIPDKLPVKAIMWYLEKLIHNPVSIPDNVVVYHLGMCSVCKRKLKDPESVKRGIGPECWKTILHSRQ